MAIRYRLELKAEGHEDLVAAGEFDDGEAGLLCQYLEQWEILASSERLRQGFPCSLNLKWDEGMPLQVHTELPDEDTLSVLLHRLRPFILSSEPASYLNVSALVGRHVDLVPIRQLLKQQRRLYDGRQFQEMISISVNDVVINNERMLTDWLNSHEYHRDPDKREAVAALMQAIPGDFARGIMVSMLVDKRLAVANLAGLVAVLLNRSDSLSFSSSERYFQAATGSA